MTSPKDRREKLARRHEREMSSLMAEMRQDRQSAVDEFFKHHRAGDKVQALAAGNLALEFDRAVAGGPYDDTCENVGIYLSMYYQTPEQMAANKKKYEELGVNITQPAQP